MSRPTDRHKTPRVLKTGAEKRKHAKEQLGRDAKLLSETRRMTEFISVQPDTQTTVHQAEPNTVDDAPVKSRENDTIEDAPILDAEAVTKKVKYSDDNPQLDETNIELGEPRNEHHISEEPLVGPINDNGDDVGLWPERMSKALVDAWVKKGASCLQWTVMIIYSS